jgi:hypothetical protein
VEFSLHYRGELKSNGTPEDKHRIRQRFHPQLKELWEQPPLKHFKELLVPQSEKGLGVIRQLGAFQFAPLLAGKLNFLAELEITLLRPGAPGNIVQSGGDIDNRLKTLLDALAIPPHPNALPRDIKPADGETPFFCVLEDDGLITKLSVHTDRLLEATRSPLEVELTVLVRTKKLVKEIGIGGLDDI